MNNKLTVVLGLGVTVSVVVLLALFITASENLDLIEYIFIVLLIGLVIGSTLIVLKRTKDIKAGLPVDDELSNKISHRAGYYAWFASIWIAVGLIWYNSLIVDVFGVPELTTEQSLGTVVLLSGVIFLGAVFYFNRKDNVE